MDIGKTIKIHTNVPEPIVAPSFAPSPKRESPSVVPPDFAPDWINPNKAPAKDPERVPVPARGAPAQVRRSLDKATLRLSQQINKRRRRQTVVGADF